jgi:hypothetical protein
MEPLSPALKSVELVQFSILASRGVGDARFAPFYTTVTFRPIPGGTPSCMSNSPTDAQTWAGVVLAVLLVPRSTARRRRCNSSSTRARRRAEVFEELCCGSAAPSGPPTLAGERVLDLAGPRLYRESSDCLSGRHTAAYCSRDLACASSARLDPTPPHSSASLA